MRFVYEAAVPAPSARLVVFSSPTEEAFWAYHRQNPWVYLELVSMARTAKRKGFERVGFRILWEALRWGRMISESVQVDLVEKFKLPNNLSSRYSRLIMKQEPDLKGFFNTRNLRS